MLPEVGMPATLCIGSDRYPGTVIEVRSDGKKIVVQTDEFKAGPGHEYFGNQKWITVRNENGPTTKFSLRKNGRWLPEGDDLHSRGTYLSLGHASAYQDPSF